MAFVPVMSIYIHMLKLKIKQGILLLIKQDSYTQDCYLIFAKRIYQRQTSESCNNILFINKQGNEDF